MNSSQASRQSLDIFESQSALEEFAKSLARDFAHDKGRLRRMFSALATCTTPEEAKSVVAFYFYRTNGSFKTLELLYKYFSQSKMTEEYFRTIVVPKLRSLYNYAMYYLLLHRRHGHG
jgi:hypothetical protein